MNRQIKQCTFNAYVTDGSSTATINGFPVSINVFSGAYTYRPYYYSGSAYDEAINGRLRSQLGGYRFEASLSWDRQLNTDPMIHLLENAYYRPTLDLSSAIDGELIIEFYPDSTETSTKLNVVISDVSVASSIEQTIIRQPISITLTGKEVSANIPSNFMI